MSGPLRLFHRVAIAEAVTWALLLAGMFLKYVTETTELGVRVFGMVHGIVFVAYVLVTLVVAVDQRWTWRRSLLGLVSAVPPFMTLWFDRHVQHDRGPDGRWRILDLPAADERRTAPERLTAWLLHNPLRGGLAGAVAVCALTGLALLVGPPTG